MIEIRLSAFHSNGDLLDLGEILNCVGSQHWQWRFIFFSGTSRQDSNLNVLELEDLLEGTMGGKCYSWGDLLSTARDVDQAIDATIAALNESGQCVFVIEVCDGTYWRILADEVEREAVAALERTRVAFPRFDSYRM